MHSLTTPRSWHTRGPLAWPWLPLAALFACVSALRRLAFRHGWLRSERLDVPVLVVGNLVAGGSGKTPATLWLVDALRRRGFHPGILSRGYGGSVTSPVVVTADSDPALVGDEPVLMARRAGVPVFVGRDRAAAGRALRAAHPEVDVLVTDDGLQHYRLVRDVEIVVLDEALLGNRWLLPAGPLREPLARARRATLLLAHGDLSAGTREAIGELPVFPMRLEPRGVYRLATPAVREETRVLDGLRLRALAGIGRPQRFFDTLKQLGIQPCERKAFPDHHEFVAADLALNDCDALLMTEKDAIKCTAIAPPQTWVLPVEADIPEAALTLILNRLERLHGSEAA